MCPEWTVHAISIYGAVSVGVGAVVGFLLALFADIFDLRR